MNRETMQSILEVKTVLLDQHSREVADIRRELETQTELGAQIQKSLSASGESVECVATIQASLKWKQSQADRLSTLLKEIEALTRDLHAAEEDLKFALAEKRAIKHLIAKLAQTT